MSTTDWLGVETEWRHALVDPALARCAEGEVSPDAEGAAYRAAVAWGRSCLFGVNLGGWDGVLAVPLARAAARRLCEELRQLRQRADRLPTFWDQAEDDIEAREECLSLLERRMEAWAAFIALDEAQLDALVNSLAGRSELAGECDQAQGELAAADEALRRQKDYLSVAAGTELLANWRGLLVEPYRLDLPWWLDGSLEAIAALLWKGLPAARPKLDDIRVRLQELARRTDLQLDPVRSRRSGLVLSQGEIQRMVDHYRRIRRELYEEGTRPLNGSPHDHQLNKEKLRQKITELCNKADLDLYRGTDHDTASRVWFYMWRINRYAGINNVIASKEISDIAPIFDDFTEFDKPSWEIEREVHTLIRAGDDARAFLERTGRFEGLQTIGNLPKLCKIVTTARKLKRFLETKPGKPILEFITGSNSPDNVWAIHKNLTTEVGYTADLTALHLMMDLGFQVIKPDIIISRLFLVWGWLHKIIDSLPSDFGAEDLQGNGKHGSRFLYTNARIYKPVINLAREIAAAANTQDLIADIGWSTNNPLRELDIFLVKYGQVPDENWGLMRTLYKNGPPQDTSCSGGECL
jgi:hypothetical protein